MADFQTALRRVLDAEGGYALTNHAGDRGGETFAGISRRHHGGWDGWAVVDELREQLLAGRGATPSDARLPAAVENFYRAHFWDAIAGDGLPDGIGDAMMSCAVLSGPATAARLAQTALEIKADGIVGPATLGALRDCADGDAGLPTLTEFFLTFQLARIARYAAIVSRDPSQRQWLLGWVNRVLAEV